MKKLRFDLFRNIEIFLLIYQGQSHFHVTLFGAGEEHHREESLSLKAEISSFKLLFSLLFLVKLLKF